MKHILITGGAGFIGSNIARRLVKNGDRVTVLDNLSSQVHGTHPQQDSPLYHSIKGQVHIIKGDICDSALLQSLLGEVDEIYHLAAETGTGQSMYQIERYFMVNVQGTACLLQALANSKHHVKKIIVSSSRAIYGEGKYLTKEGLAVYPKTRSIQDIKNGNFNLRDEQTGEELMLVATPEDAQANPISVYGLTKKYQENMIMEIAPTLGISPIAVRYQNVYGPGQSLSNPYTGILAIFSTRILNNNPIEVFEDGLESRDFVYIDDVVDATISVVNNAKSDQQIFNIGTGVATTAIDVARMLLDLYEKKLDIKITGGFRVGDIRHNFADITKIKTLIGFDPKFSFKTGLKHFVNWVKTQQVGEDKFDYSMSELKAKGLFK